MAVLAGSLRPGYAFSLLAGAMRKDLGLSQFLVLECVRDSWVCGGRDVPRPREVPLPLFTFLFRLNFPFVALVLLCNLFSFIYFDFT